MTWLALRPFLPYILACTLGFGGAWKIQGYRITGVEQEYAKYKTDQTQLRNEAIDYANKQRDKSAAAYDAAKNDLAAANLAHSTYARCVAAGKCGVRSDSGSTGIRLPASSGVDGSGSNTIPTQREPAEALANECATTTLMLNSLQGDIEAQKGY